MTEVPARMIAVSKEFRPYSLILRSSCFTPKKLKGVLTKVTRCASFKTNYKHNTDTQLTDRIAVEINQTKIAPKNGTFHRF